MPTHISDNTWYDAAEVVVNRLADKTLLPTAPNKVTIRSFENVQVCFRGEWLDVAHEDGGEAVVATYPPGSVVYVSGIATPEGSGPRASYI